MTCVDDIASSYFHRINSAKGAEDHLAGAADLKPENALTREQRFKTLPSQIDVHALLRGHVGASLDDEFIAVQVALDHVAGQGGGEPDLAAAGAAGEVIEKKRLAGQHALGRF